MKLNEVINNVLIENNKHWLTKEQALYSLSEGRLVITKNDVIDIINNLPIQIYGNNIDVQITDEGIIVKETAKQ